MQPNLYLPGLLPDGQPRTLIDIPGYARQSCCEQRRGGRGDAYEDELLGCLRHDGPASLVRLDRIDRRSGRVLQRTYTHNVITDYGANALLKIFGNGGAGVVAPYLAIDTAAAASQQSGATITSASGAQSSIALASGGLAAYVAGNAASSFLANATAGAGQNNSSTPAYQVPDPRYGTGIAWSYGITASVEYPAGTLVPGSNVAINIASYTVTAGKSHAAGDWVVAGPSTADGSGAAPAGIQYSPAQTATYTAPQGATGGIGYRKAQLQYIFPTTTPAGSYTGIWVVTSASWSAGVAYAHITTSPQIINAQTSLQVTWIDAL